MTRFKMNPVALLVIAGALLTCMACGPGLMTQAQTIKTAPADKALVTFVRVRSYGGGSNFVVWDSKELVGSLVGGQYIQREVAPGEHLFIVHAQNWAFIKANVEAGKKYYVLINTTIGFSHATAIPVPLNHDTKWTQADIDQWMATLDPVMPHPEGSIEWAAKRQPQMEKAIAKSQEPGAKFQYLNPEDTWE